MILTSMVMCFWPWLEVIQDLKFGALKKQSCAGIKRQ